MIVFKRFFFFFLVIGIGCGIGWFSHEDQPLFLSAMLWVAIPLAFFWGLSSPNRVPFFIAAGFGYYFAQYSWGATLKTPAEMGVWQNIGSVFVCLCAFWKIGQLYCAVHWSRFPVDKTPRTLSAFIALFVLFEWVQQWLFCGESFYPLSSILLRHPFFYPLFACFGVYGVSLLLLNVTLTPLFFPKKKESYAAWLLYLAALFARNPIEMRGEAHVALYQTAFAPFTSEEELKAQEKHAFMTMLKTLEGKQIDCLVFSETRLPGRYLEHNPYVEILKALSKEQDIDIIVGHLHKKKDGKLCNSATLIHQGEFAGRYDKIRLMSLMESKWDFLPESFLEAINAGDFVAGAEKSVLRGKFNYGVHICYDDYFGRDQWNWRHQNLDLVVSLHNDVWVEAPTFKWNHFQQSILRALEIGVPVVRVANGGVVGTISPEGKTNTVFSGDGVQFFTVLLEKTTPLYVIFQDRFFLFYLFLSLGSWGLEKYLARRRVRQEEVDENAL